MYRNKLPNNPALSKNKAGLLRDKAGLLGSKRLFFEKKGEGGEGVFLRGLKINPKSPCKMYK